MYYKYINPTDENDMRFLVNNELFFSNPKKWETDKEYEFEFEKINYEKLYDDLLGIFINIYNDDKILYLKVVDNFNNLLPNDFTYLEQFDQLICNHIVMNIKSHKNEYLQGLKKKYYEKTGIFCLSNIKNSSALWDYKKDDRSNCICVGIDKDLLINFLKLQKNIVCKDVVYYDKGNIPKKNINNFSDENKKVLEFLEIAFSLPNKLINEKETRIVKVFPNGEENERIIILPNNLYKEVIFSEGMEKELIDSIKSICFNKGINNFDSQIL